MPLGSAVHAEVDSQWSWFWWEEVSDGLYLIRERFFEPSKRANIWLLQGSQRDLVIDTGLGLMSLPRFLSSAGLIGTKPVMAVVTHIHFDHSGGLHHFDRAAVHRAEASALMRGDNFETATWLSDWDIKRRPQRSWRAKNYRVKAVQPARILDDGDIINLGNRQLTVLHMPGHSRGSICLHDKENRILFSGDVVYDGSMIDWLPSSNISDYIQTCKHLMTLVDNNLVIKVLPGHFDTFDAERLYSLASNYIANVGVCHKILSCAARCIASLALWFKNYSKRVDH
ncbi:metallo-beta-lactamase domain-containing protein 2 [Carcharodon carcharias]|uniref:metallo-beta-lactamase domain-containing protein 2 n=1 Tax=Carcharodon carcharias TaxID=13397 RepID=UPI001B7E4A43|nr:metallo-beta-lactamase domain-containing protein 2 [Carcharodon carcharias]